MTRYTENQLSKVISRDFPDHPASEIQAILDTFGQESWHQETLRVKLGCLKLADGNLDKLREFVKVACVDYRDVLAWAEYPNQMRAPIGMPNEDAATKDAMQLRDWFNK